MIVWVLACTGEPGPAPPTGNDDDTATVSLPPLQPGWAPVVPPVLTPPEPSFQVAGDSSLGTLSYGPPLTGVVHTPDGPRLLVASLQAWWFVDVRARQDVVLDAASITWSGPDASLGAAVGDVDGDGTDDVWAGAVLLSGASGTPDVVLGEVAAGTGLGIAGDRVVTWDATEIQLWDAPFPVGGPAAATLATELPTSVDTVGDLTGDGVVDLVAVAPWSDGIAWLLTDPVVGSAALSDVAAATLHLDGLERTSGGDLDGDGLGELVVAPCDLGTASGTLDGQTLYVLDPGTGAIDVADAAWARLITHEPFCRASIAIADLDGDGTDDLALGGSVFAAGYKGHDLGTVWVLDGPVQRGATVDIAQDGRVYNVGPYTEFGRQLRAGDLDEDGQDELLVSGSLGSAWATGSQPSVWVLNGP